MPIVEWIRTDTGRRHGLGTICMNKLPYAFATVLALTACGNEQPKSAQIRPVRTVVVKRTTAGEMVSLTGQVQAQNQVNLAFRVGGRLLDRLVSMGDRVIPGQVVAHIEPQDAQNTLHTAQADLSAGLAALTTAQNAEGRQRELLSKGFTTAALYDQAQQQLQTTQAQVDSARARLRTAQDNLGYTELKSEVGGVITTKAAEPGDVVQAGQTILQVARHGGRDAVFNVPAQLIRTAPKNPLVTVVLADDPSVTATGRVREVAPQADPTTGTFVVKIGLDSSPDTMRLGATVVGSIAMVSEPVVQLPGTALTQSNGKPAVWVVDPTSKTVSLRDVQVLRYDPASAILSDGLTDDEIVVTAGVQALRPGQAVRLLDPPESARK
jgi:membrane fusion protein, multidrug efflux system